MRMISFKNLIAAMGFLTISASLTAQLIPYAGISVGYASSNLKINPEPASDFSSLPSFAAGIQLEWFDNPIIGMTSDIDYFQGGASSSSGSDIAFNQISIAQQLAIFVPMVSKKWESYVSAGPQLSYFMDQVSPMLLSDDDYNNLTFGWRFGLGINYVLQDAKIFLTGEYLMDSADRFKATNPATSFKDRTILVSLGYMYEF